MQRKDRGLAAAARAEQAADRAALEREAQSRDHLVLAVDVAQLFDFEQHTGIIVIILINVKIAAP